MARAWNDTHRDDDAMLVVVPDDPHDLTIADLTDVLSQILDVCQDIEAAELRS